MNLIVFSGKRLPHDCKIKKKNKKRSLLDDNFFKKFLISEIVIY
jgi:hypothetical protein